jgi:hypothetical protein
LGGPIGLFCALLVSACADSSSTVPTSPSAVVPGDASLGKAHGNGHGNSNGHGNGNGNGNASSNQNGNGNGNGNPNGNRGNGPPTQTPGPPESKKVEIEGVIQAIVGQVLTVNDQHVFVPLTVIVHHGSEVVPFGNLHIGDRVHMRAWLVLDVLTASDVKLQNPAEGVVDGVGDTELVGVVSAFTVVLCPDATFLLGTQLVRVDASTLPVDVCASLANDLNVHVDGNLQLDSSVLATNVTILP